MKLLKKVSLCLMLALSIGVLYGCSNNASPSDFVKSEIDEIKDADDKLVSIMLKAMSAGEGEGEVEFTNELLKQAQRLEYEITSEDINGDEAVVTLDIHGFDLETTLVTSMTEIARVGVEQVLAGVNTTDEENEELVMKIMTDTVKNSDLSDRTIKVNLIKEKSSWKFANENDLYLILFNFDPASFDYNNIDKYIDEDALYDSINEAN
ncbi:hypothetical protein E5347_04725 [Clostridium sartagoforme]|uniref:DUF5105 domain-containing protein n=1 Tax=Clostridium sartagoforme TaxID=84031 RepID=A0A4S2DSC2_9CLOT|nr:MULTISPECIES: hypothetical protein [Clostridium]MBS5937578.1 hypothetical protein [Clostridium sp.]TGY44124.1 hypothetical protein E5347_04725 [Clostridium sartagoforme]